MRVIYATLRIWLELRAAHSRHMDVNFCTGSGNKWRPRGSTYNPTHSKPYWHVSTQKSDWAEWGAGALCPGEHARAHTHTQNCLTNRRMFAANWSYGAYRLNSPKITLYKPAREQAGVHTLIPEAGVAMVNRAGHRINSWCNANGSDRAAPIMTQWG